MAFNSRQKEVGVFAVHFNAWSYQMIASAIGLSAQAVKEAGSARIEPYRSLSRRFRMNPFEYIERHVPFEILEYLDGGELIPPAAYEVKPRPCDCYELIFDWWWDRFGWVRYADGNKAKFFQPMRNGVLFAANQGLWADVALINAFGVTPSTLWYMRHQDGVRYSEFHADLEEARATHGPHQALESLRDKYYSAFVHAVLAEAADAYGIDEDLVRKKLRIA